MSSWLGASVLSLGEWFIKRMPFVRHIYSASKQISSAISPGVYKLGLNLCFLVTEIMVITVLVLKITDQNSQAFKEVAIIRHPRIGEYAFGFITSSFVLQVHQYLISVFLIKNKYK